MATRSSKEPLPYIGGPEDFAGAFGVSRETIERLTTYAALLRQWQKAVNLVSPATLDAIWHRHFADSAQLLALAPAALRWVDLGSGAGFPGLVVAILLSEAAPAAPGRSAHVTLIESNTRKCAFLREVVRQTGIAPGLPVDILSTRIEKTATHGSLLSPDIVSARALAPLDKLLALAAPLFSSGTVGLFLKGREVAAEVKAAEKLWDFNVELAPSRTDPDGRIAIVRRLERKN